MVGPFAPTFYSLIQNNFGGDIELKYLTKFRSIWKRLCTFLLRPWNVVPEVTIPKILLYIWTFAPGVRRTEVQLYFSRTTQANESLHMGVERGVYKKYVQPLITKRIPCLQNAKVSASVRVGAVSFVYMLMWFDFVCVSVCVGRWKEHDLKDHCWAFWKAVKWSFDAGEMN